MSIALSDSYGNQRRATSARHISFGLVRQKTRVIGLGRYSCACQVALDEAKGLSPLDPSRP